MKQKVIVSWSGGKDSALSLHAVQADHEVVALVTTVTEDDERIAAHGVRRALLERQTEALGYPLKVVPVSHDCPNEEYEAKMRAVLQAYHAVGVTAVVCGDLFLEDVRRYREERLFSAAMKGIFPLWGRGTRELAHEFLTLGFKAVLCSVDTAALHSSFAGRYYDGKLLEDLPAAVDPCGENGEFHSFVFDGPTFTDPVRFTTGERILKQGRFCHCDLVPQA
jgi:uncharacterized protein (TIGR00290 family)